MKKEKSLKFYTTEDVQSYVNFIFDNDLQDELTEFETGYKDGNFFIDIEGDIEIISKIKRKSMKTERGKYIRQK